MALVVLRRQAILDLLRRYGGMSTHELAKRLGVSEATIRRDLALLAQQGLLQRDHGGAFLSEGEPPYALKLRQNREAKEAIAKKALELVSEGNTVILDSGTTTLALARLLAGKPIRAIALDVPVAQAMAKGDTEVLIVGGIVRNGFYSLVGSWACEFLEGLRADVFFMGADAFDLDGVTNYTFEEAMVKRKAMAVSQATVLLADRSKWGRRAPAFVAPLTSLSQIITDFYDATLAVKVPLEVVHAEV